MLRAALRRLLSLDEPPERTALAFSVGVFIGFSPFLGLHTIIAALLAFIFRFNKVALFTGVYVNNPLLTLVPIVLASYAIGAFVLGRPLRPPQEGLDLLTNPRLFDGSYWRQLWTQSGGVLSAFAIGSLVLSVTCSVAAYPLTLRALRARQARRDKPAA